jgi:MFS family permease
LSRLSIFFQHADFRRLASGAAWHSASFQGEQVLVGLMVYRMTGSTMWVGIAYALAFTPMLIVGLPAGMSADRFDRRALLPIIEGAAFVIMALMAVAAAMGLLTIPVVLVAVFFTGCIRALHHPVRLSYAHDVLGPSKLVGALGMLSVVSRFGQLIGALAAGWAMEYAGADTGYAVLATMHLFGLITFGRLQTTVQTKESREQSFRSSISEYLHELRTNPVMWRLTAVASAVEIFGFSFATALPELASNTLNVGAEGLGYLHGARSVGGLLAGLALAWAGTLHRTGFTFIGVVIGFGVALLALGASPSLVFALTGVALVAGCASSCDILVQTMLQTCVPDHLRGRAMGAWVLALGAGPIGHLQVGALAAVFGAGVTLMANGGVLILLGVLTAVSVPAIRKMR